MFKNYKPVLVKSLGKYKIWISYSDGTEGIIDLLHLANKGVFSFWEKDNNFDKVYIDQESNAIAWNEFIDIDPDNIYFKLKKLNPLDLVKN